MVSEQRFSSIDFRVKISLLVVRMISAIQIKTVTESLQFGVSKIPKDVD
jgi:hypothetical protein